MPARSQLVIDCKDSEPLTRFGAAALGYVPEPPPGDVYAFGLPA